MRVMRVMKQTPGVERRIAGSAARSRGGVNASISEEDIKAFQRGFRVPFDTVKPATDFARDLVGIVLPFGRR